MAFNEIFKTRHCDNVYQTLHTGINFGNVNPFSRLQGREMIVCIFLMWELTKRLLTLFCVYAGVTVTPSVRLVGGGSDYEGRLQVFYDGVWSTVCDRYWSQHNSDVVCRSAFGAG